MKKNKIYMSLFAAVITAACGSPEESGAGPDQAADSGKWTIQAGETSSRAVIGDADNGVRPVKWESGDILTVFNAAAAEPFTLDSGAETSDGVFGSYSESITDGTNYYAAYARKNSSYTEGAGLTIEMPSPFEVTGSADDFVGDYMVMVSDAFSFTEKKTSGWIELSKKTAVLEIPVKVMQGSSEAIASVKMEAPVGNYFVSKAVFDGAGQVDYTTTGEITVKFDPALALDPLQAVTVKLVVWMNPGITEAALAGGEFTFTFTDDQNALIDEVKKKAVRLEGGKYYNSPLMGTISAEQKTIAYVKTLADGEITDDIYISGRIVADGNADNLAEGTYSIQDDSNNAILFKVSGTVPFERYDEADILLTGAAVESVTEGAFTYKILTGISNARIIGRTAGDGSFKPAEITIGSLTTDMLHAVVTLKDVEIASPYGAFTNFKKSISTGNPNPDYMAQYPAYYRFYPTCIRDIAGDNMYLLTSPEASFAVTALPQGGGKITGMVVREVLTNFGITEDQLCIRPLELSDVELDPSRDNGFTSVLVEWDCAIPSTSSTGVPWPIVAPSTGDANAILNKSNATGFSNGRINMADVYQADEFRGDQANDGRVTSRAYNSLNWTADVYWYIDKVSTTGITTAMSLQIESNGSWDSHTRNMKVQYAIADAWDAADIAWIDVPGGDYVVLGQFDRSAANGKSPNHIVGYKVYDFKLPAALNGQSNICLRLIPDGGSVTGGNRLANVSIKYNKE